MRRRIGVDLVLLSVATALWSLPVSAQAGSSQTAAAAKSFQQATEILRNMPLRFEPNVGQTDSQVRFLTRADGMTTFLTGKENVIVLSRRKSKSKSDQAVVRIKFEGAAVPRRFEGLNKAASISNYFIGNDPSKHRPNVPNYPKVKAWGLYPGIDVVYYGNGRNLEYDFVVAPGADPARIRLSFKGADRLTTDASGNLIVSTGAGDLVQRKPVVYQEYGGARHVIEARYIIRGKNVEFALAGWDRSRELVIDPTLEYSTFLSGNFTDTGYAIKVDQFGAAFVVGTTNSTDFPDTAGSFHYDDDPIGQSWSFVTKVSSTGRILHYSTYLAGFGNNDVTSAYGVDIDSFGNAFVTGSTSSTTFPTTSNAFHRFSAGGLDSFVVKLNFYGSAFLYSTYLGGRFYDRAWGIAVDSSGHAYVTGETGSDNFPVTPGAFQPISLSGVYPMTFVTKLDFDGGGLRYSTYVGGTANDYAYAIAVDGSGNAYVTGSTYSVDFPTTPGAFRPLHDGGASAFNAFVFKRIQSAQTFSIRPFWVRRARTAMVLPWTQPVPPTRPDMPGPTIQLPRARFNHLTVAVPTPS